MKNELDSVGNNISMSHKLDYENTKKKWHNRTLNLKPRLNYHVDIFTKLYIVVVVVTFLCRNTFVLLNFKIKLIECTCSNAFLAFYTLL